MNTMYHHQFMDPTQTAINYSDISLMGSSSSNNNSSSFSHDQQPNFDNPDPSTLFKMLTPSNFHHDGSSHFLGDVPMDSGATLYYDPTIGFNVRDHVYQYSVENNNGISAVGNFVGFEDGTNFCGELNEGMIQLGGKRKKKGVEVIVGTKNEKQRRERLSKKYDVLKALIPTPSKPDRATIVADTIAYIQELLRTIDELKMLVEKKHRKKSGIMKSETVEDAAGDNESSCVKPLHSLRSSLRSSWLQRKSNDTHVDVRIVEDEVFIKLTQHKKTDCLVIVARVLDDLELDLLHLSGGNVGDLHVFMFNSKIHEGSSVYAGAIAKKIIEVMDAKHQELFVSF